MWIYIYIYLLFIYTDKIKCVAAFHNLQFGFSVLWLSLEDVPNEPIDQSDLVLQVASQIHESQIDQGWL